MRVAPQTRTWSIWTKTLGAAPKTNSHS
uniref:Uncharacterized protein n=1 Tax=Anopheles minimus TaxID=112268 RepID=A0A182WN63_9DIPT